MNQNDTLVAAGDRHVLRMERRYPHAPDKVWRALTEPSHFNRWFPFELEEPIPTVVGERFALVDEGGEMETEATVTEHDAPRVLAFDWEGEALRFELSGEGDGCVLVFTHGFEDRYGAASFASGWDGCFGAAGLAAVLDGRSPEVDSGINERHEEYLAAFGLDAPEVGVDGDVWTVRVERQLTQPAARVWELLTGSGRDEPAVGGPVPGGFVVPGAAAGAVREVTPGSLLEYEWRPVSSATGGPAAGLVRWELREGTGHGPRLVLTHSGPAGDDAAVRDGLAAAWRERIGELAAKLASEPRPGG